MNVETKGNVGDKVYLLKKITQKICPICAGSRRIQITASIPTPDPSASLAKAITDNLTYQFTEAAKGNLKVYPCPECGGKGVVKMTGQPKYAVVSGVITSVEISLNNNGADVFYHVLVDGETNNRRVANADLFNDQDAAQKMCDFMNLERRMVPIGDITISHCFASTIPCNEKLNKRLDEWRRNRQFTTEIFVDKSLKLFDGYTSYLVYKMLGVANVPVVIWPNGNTGNK